MVSAVILLFTVSTLGTPIFSIPTKEYNIQHACKGKTLCDVKPDDYPQEMVDRVVKRNLHILQRSKRQSDYDKIPDEEYTDTNNCVADRMERNFFSKIYDDGASQVIVQSDYYSQTVTEVRCKTQGGKCFKDLTIGSPQNFGCDTVFTTVKLVFLTKGGELKHENVTIPTDCVCAKL